MKRQGPAERPVEDGRQAIHTHRRAAVLFALEEFPAACGAVPQKVPSLLPWGNSLLEPKSPPSASKNRFSALDLSLSLSPCNDIPQPGWLQLQIFLSHSSGGCEVQGQRPSGSGSWRELSSWLADGCLALCPPAVERESSGLTSSSCNHGPAPLSPPLTPVTSQGPPPNTATLGYAWGICWGSKPINMWTWGDADNQATAVPGDEPPLRTGLYGRHDLVEVASGLSLSLSLSLSCCHGPRGNGTSLLHWFTARQGLQGLRALDSVWPSPDLGAALLNHVTGLRGHRVPRQGVRPPSPAGLRRW